MSNIMALRGELRHRKYPSKKGGGPSMGKKDRLAAHKIQKIILDIQDVLINWPNATLVEDILVDVHYDTVVAKSNRAKFLLPGSLDRTHGVVGARYEYGKNGTPYHIITYYVTAKTLEDAIKYLKIVQNFLSRNFEQGEITSREFDLIGDKYQPPTELPKTNLKQWIHDCVHIAKVLIPHAVESVEDDVIVNLFPTEITAVELFGKDELLDRSTIIDETTLLLTPAQYRDLAERAPYLIAMAHKDKFNVAGEIDDGDWGDDPVINAPNPNGEPIIGVIDTLFDEDCDLGSWVDYHHQVPDGIPINNEDYEHGTHVSSLIVAGHVMNPNYDDGCGWFRVRHFGVALKRGNSSRRLLRDIKKIVEDNPDIKVWNLSLGEEVEISDRYISPVAACLDELQSERNILFIVAGTNDNERTRNKMIGSPADSINSIVVNSVNSNGEPASYSRKEPVLSFFNKPDLAYYGGDSDGSIKVLDTIGISSDSGTSYAAPWVARKAAYLIEVMHLPRDVAKALLIDSALSWNSTILSKGSSLEVGHGILPIKISDVLKAQDDELKFYISGNVEQYETYSPLIPIPTENLKFPYAARAVLCYAPACSKRQGVDYTNTELSLSFGRNKDAVRSNGEPYVTIEPIKDKYISAPYEYVPYESAVRIYGRKWDNTKVKIEKFQGAKPKEIKAITGGWGLSIKKTERLDDFSGEGMPFGLVVTLKALDGDSRIDDFVQQCVRRGWSVREIKQEKLIAINQRAQTQIKLD